MEIFNSIRVKIRSWQDVNIKASLQPASSINFYGEIWQERQQALQSSLSDLLSGHHKVIQLMQISGFVLTEIQWPDARPWCDKITQP